MNNVETNLLNAAANHLRVGDLTVAINKARHDDHVDAWLRVTKDKHCVDYALEVKRQVTPQTLGSGAVKAEDVHLSLEGRRRCCDCYRFR